MGGAYIALSDDTSGTYYNPAGITQPNSGGISGSVNVLHAQHITYVNAIRNADWDRSSLELMPNFFGLVQTFGKHSFGAAISTPDSFVQHQDQVFSNIPATATQEAIDKFSLNLHANDGTYIFGPTYSYKMNDEMAVGITLGYNYRSSRAQQDQTIWYPNATYENSYSSATWSEQGIQPKVGFLWNVNPKLSLGAVIDHVFIFLSNYSADVKTKARASNDMVMTQTSSKSKRNTTTHLGLGSAYQVAKPLLIALDINIYFPPSKDIFFPNGYNFVMNWALGTEYAINEKNTVRMGFYTNKTNMPMPTAQTTLVSHIDMYGVSAGYSLNYESTSFTIGLIYSAGIGDSQIYSDINEVVQAKNYSMTGVLSTNYKF